MITNPAFLIPITLQPDVEDLLYFILLIMLDQIVSVLNKGVRHQVAKI